jgi:UDP-glucose 4-epimerase
MSKRIFITGGAGYIGSHTCVDLLQKDNEVLVFDDLSNSSREALDRVAQLTNKRVSFVIGDLKNKVALNKAISSFKPDGVIHFAGLKAVVESVSDPLRYYDVNVLGTINLLQAMSNIDCNEIIFSSSATVYGEMNQPPFNEAMPVSPVSPYGRTKLMVEDILRDWVISGRDNRAVVLRYFNPVGAHASGLLGEDPKDIPNNLMPLVVQTAQKKRRKLNIFGSDYDTRDGTGERDYIHVTDLAQGHLKAVESIKNLQRFQVLNLGSGSSTTVKELIATFEKTNKVSIPSRLVARRPGDVAKSLADPSLARDLIGFECKKTLKEMCKDTWNWVQKNPNGYS